MERKKYEQFTKKDIAAVLDLWQSHTKEQIAASLGRSVQNVGYLAMKMRKLGIELPKKHRRGQLDSLIREVIEERERRMRK